MTEKTYSKLFGNFQLGKIDLRNRIIMTGMSSNFAGPGGFVTDQLIEYYATRAAGGVGMVTVDLAGIHPQLYHVKNELGIFGDHHIAGLQKVTKRIHDEGAAASIQIGVYFRQNLNGFVKYSTNKDALGCNTGCLELNKDEIYYLTGLFAKAADRARLAGFDAVEVHACHGCILAEFLSPFWNKRNDKYGGSQENRFRFALEVLDRIRKTVGPDYPVIFRISGSEFHSEGFTSEDGITLAIALEQAGVTAINVSGGLSHIDHIAICPSHVPRGIFLPLAQDIKKRVNIPVIVGNALTPDLALQAIESKQADLVGLGRPLIADPEWPRKVKEGHLNEIRPCIRCNQGCFAGIRDPQLKHITCMYNPLVGREGEHLIKKSETKMHVVVVGGGPAGCEFARVAKLRGNDVVLFEKDETLGGQFNLASVLSEKEDFKFLVRYYSYELQRLGVDVRLNTEATPENLSALDADIYALATGSMPSKPPIPGVEQAHVYTAHEILSGQVKIEEGPVVVIGGGATGLETAKFMSDNKLKVTIIEILDSPGRDIIAGIGIREHLLASLSEKHVEIMTGRRVIKIERNAVIISDRPLIGGGHEDAVAAKSVVLAMGQRPDITLMETNISACKGVWYQIGDCSCPGNAYNAIHVAFELAIKI